MYFFIDKYRYKCSFHWQIQVSRYCLSKDLRMGVVIAEESIILAEDISLWKMLNFYIFFMYSKHKMATNTMYD